MIRIGVTNHKDIQFDQIGVHQDDQEEKAEHIHIQNDQISIL